MDACLLPNVEKEKKAYRGAGMHRTEQQQEGNESERESKLGDGIRSLLCEGKIVVEFSHTHVHTYIHGHNFNFKLSSSKAYYIYLADDRFSDKRRTVSDMLIIFYSR